MATHTGMRSPRFSYSAWWAAPVLCTCQCMPVVCPSKTCMRYMPMLRRPFSGLRVITSGVVM